MSRMIASPYLSPLQRVMLSASAPAHIDAMTSRLTNSLTNSLTAGTAQPQATDQAGPDGFWEKRIERPVARCFNAMRRWLTPYPTLRRVLKIGPFFAAITALAAYGGAMSALERFDKAQYIPRIKLYVLMSWQEDAVKSIEAQLDQRITPADVNEARLIQLEQQRRLAEFLVQREQIIADLRTDIAVMDSMAAAARAGLDMRHQAIMGGARQSGIILEPPPETVPLKPGYYPEARRAARQSDRRARSMLYRVNKMRERAGLAPLGTLDTTAGTRPAPE